MALTDRTSKRTAFVLIGVLLIVILILSFLVGGVSGVAGVIRFFMMASMVVLFLSFLFYIVYYIFFKKHRHDVPYENWKSYMHSALENGADMMGEMVLTGDKNHSAKRFMTIKGYLRIMAFDGQEYDLFVGKRNTLNMFEEYKIVMLEPDKHSDLIGDVYVYGISLIMKYGYYFLNSKMLDFEAIDKTVAYDTYRSILYHTLGDMKGIVDRATGIDPEFSKDRQSEKLLKIPMLTGQQNSRDKES